MQKGVAPIFILIIVLIIVGGIFGGKYLLNKSPKTINQENSNQTEVNTPTGRPSYPSSTPSLLKESKSSDAKGKVAFVSEGEIWTVNSDRTELKQITKDENNKFHISLSSDGKKIAYGFYPKDEKKERIKGTMLATIVA